MLVKLRAFIFILVSLLVCNLGWGQTRKSTRETTDLEPLPAITWEATSFDFGTLKQGEKAQTSFNFTNTGKTPLIISNVLTTCGCTATEWSKAPIAPNGTGKITVTFNSAGKMGRQNKIVTIVSNAGKDEQLTLSGVVIASNP